jgi:aspartyl-tRNA synthetase
MSFVEQEDVLELLERHFVALSTDLTPDPSPTSRGEKTLTYSPFLRLTRDECMNTYGIDKPELRTQAMQLIDLTTR